MKISGDIHHFLSDDEVNTAVKMWLRQQDAELYRDGHLKQGEAWRECVHRRGDYVEKLLCRIAEKSSRKLPAFSMKCLFALQKGGKIGGVTFQRPFVDLAQVLSARSSLDYLLELIVPSQVKYTFS
jgi:hypothetical protein